MINIHPHKADEICFLSFQDELEASIASATGPNLKSQSTNTSVARTHVNALRVLIDSLNDLIRSRSRIVERAERLLNSDFIRPVIEITANQLERSGSEVTAAAFDDVSNNSLAKYDDFVDAVSQTQSTQADTLREIQVSWKMSH